MTRHSRPSTPRGQAILWAGASTAAIGVVGAVLAVLSLSAGPVESPAAASRAAARGYTDVVTVPIYAAGSARPATRRPAKLAPMIASTGACKVAMDAVRDLQDANPGGLNIAQPAALKLSGLLAKLGPATGAACAPALAMKFRSQELDPWLLWYNPALAVTAPPAKTPTPKPAKPAKPSPAKSPASTPSPSTPAK